MAAVIEVKFFNSFVLKKTVSNSNIPVWNGSTGVPSGTAGSFPINPSNTTNQDDSYYIEVRDLAYYYQIVNGCKRY